MCGIAGLLPGLSSRADSLDIVLRMIASLQHRGPDDMGHWIDPKGEVILGHRRLSILDLSPDGHQPMLSPGGRFAMVFNGEIYNFMEMRGLLENAGVSFNGHSDTEVLLAGFEEWGVVPTIERSHGMFALGVWDRIERRLSLVRDRLGEKPLYWGRVQSDFLFASELKAFRAHPDFSQAISTDSVARFFSIGVVPSPHTIYRGVFKLEPGKILSFQPHLIQAGECQTKSYWKLPVSGGKTQENELSLSPGTSPSGFENAVADLEVLLEKVVKREMVADVPLGAFLSSGVDSSLIVGLMQRVSRRQTQTFSIGFQEEEMDESVHAARIARYLETNHTQHVFSSVEASALVACFPQWFDEPFSDPSALPTFMVSRLARTKVTVAVTGDGGDELFGGYSWYRMFRTKAFRLAALGRQVPFASTIAACYDLFTEFSGPLLLPLGKTIALVGGRNRRFFDLKALEEWLSTCSSIIRLPAPESFSTEYGEVGNLVFQRMLLDQASYLPEMLLTKTDRVSMSVSLEARAPFLDHSLVEFANSLPLSWKVGKIQGKRILRALLRKFLPPELILPGKKGFGIPLSAWLRTSLKGWAFDLLRFLESSSYREFFHWKNIWKEWEIFHGAETTEIKPVLWRLVCFAAWASKSHR